MWTQPVFKPLRSFIHVVTSKPSMYPPYIHPEATYISNVNPTTPTIPLSKGFVCGVYDRSCLSSKDPNYCPILQVMAVSTRHCTVFLQSLPKNDNSKHTTLHAVDANLQTGTVKIASQMNSYTGMIKCGSVIKLLKFNTIYFDYKKGESKFVTLFGYLYTCSYTIGSTHAYTRPHTNILYISS